MADPQTEKLLEQVIIQLAQVNGWSDAVALAEMEQALILANRAEQGDVNAQAQLDALFRSVGVIPRSQAPATQPGQPAPVLPGAGADAWKRGLPDPGANMEWRRTPDPRTVEKWTVGSELMPAEFVRSYKLPEGAAADAGDGALPSVDIRELNWALENNLISQEEYERRLQGALPGGVGAAGGLTLEQDLAEAERLLGRPLTAYERSRLVLGFAAPGGGGPPAMTPYQSASLAQRDREFEANIELDRIETALTQQLAAISAAKSGNPLEWMALTRGGVPTAGGTETYQGFPRLVPPSVPLESIGVLPGGAPPAPPAAPPRPPVVSAPAPPRPPAPSPRDGITGSAPTSFLDLMGPRDPVDLALSALSTATRDTGMPRAPATTTPAPSRDVASAPPLPRAPSVPGSTVNAGTPWVAPPAPKFMQDIQAGRPLAPWTYPPGTRLPGVTAQANMSPFELAAFKEREEFRGVPLMDLEAALQRVRRGVGPGAPVGSYGGKLRIPT